MPSYSGRYKLKPVVVRIRVFKSFMKLELEVIEHSKGQFGEFVTSIIKPV